MEGLVCLKVMLSGTGECRRRPEHEDACRAAHQGGLSVTTVATLDHQVDFENVAALAQASWVCRSLHTYRRASSVCKCSAVTAEMVRSRTLVFGPRDK